VANLPDDELAYRVANGEQQALLHLYDRHSTRVYALALRVLGDPMAAEEITQDVFFKLWSHANSFLSSRGAFATWLLSIARHAAIDHLRLERRRPVLADDEEMEDGWAELPSEKTTSEEARWRDLYFAVRALPPNQRQVIQLAYYHGMSHSQIAEHLGWPLGTVKTRLRMAMEQLREQWLEKSTEG
jgi:RNA polymerase sigma-70 factor (ECF subfamily)